MKWNQNPEPNVTAYRVFVGTLAGSYTETFDVPGSQTSFVYSDAVPGRRYYVAVAAQVGDAIWGPRSSETSGTAGTPETPGEPTQSSTSLAVVRNANLVTGSTGDPLVASASIQVVASGLAPVSALAVSPAGTGLFVEDGNRIRAFGLQGLQAAPALELDADTRIEDVVLDAGFDQNGLAFLATSRTRRHGGREVGVERQRLLAGSLGESIAVIPGLATGQAAETAIAVASDGRIAVAQPGAVLIFAPDGRVAAGATGLREGLTSPASIAWDPSGQTVWLTGRDAGGSAVVERLAGHATAVAALPSSLTEDAPLALVSHSGRMSVAAVTAEAVLSMDPTNGATTRLPANLAGHGDPVLVSAPSPGGPAAWYVVLRARRPDGITADTVIRVAAPPVSPEPIQR